MKTLDSQLQHLLSAAPLAIFGAGISGRAVLALCRHRGLSGIFYDENSSRADRSEFDAEAARTHRVVVFSPGFPPHHRWLQIARSAGCLCLGELDFASLFWPGRLLAVTGTNGKTTLADFLGRLLHSAGGPVCVCGNSGTPFSLIAAEEFSQGATAVVEVSSFQAETLSHFHPEVVFWTNFSETHLDRHGSLVDYFQAKLGLVRQLPAAGVWACDESVLQFAAAAGFSLPPALPTAHIAIRHRDLPSASAFAHPGQFRNLLVALAWWRHLGGDEDFFLSVAETFPPRKNRLQKIGQYQGTAFWNDAKSTNFASTLAALSSFEGPVVWIGGGQYRGGSLAEFAARLQPFLRAAVLIGETAGPLQRELQALGIDSCTRSTLEEAVAAAHTLAAGADVVFSPGFASFDQFSGYQERGHRFARSVQELASLHLSSSNFQPKGIVV